MKTKKAFTLIELLVVIAIIALLLSIVMPGLNMAKKKASAIACMANVRSLSMGWFMYQEENSGNIMSASIVGRDAPNGGRIPPWIRPPYHTTMGDRTQGATTPVVTDEDEIRGMKLGVLWPYIEAPDTYNCPADKVKSVYDLSEKLVTYAIASGLAGHGNHCLKTFKFSDISSPSLKYNFIENAEQRNFMNGMFVFGTPQWTGADHYAWWNPIAVNHGDSSTLGFCDGHAETRKWRESNTKERVKRLETEGVYGIDESGRTNLNDEDLAYMVKGWADR